MILVRDPDEYLRDTTWADAFGHPVRHTGEVYGKLTSLRVWYQHGLEVEFGFSDENWPSDPGGQAIIADGMKVLLDRGPLQGLVQK